jgi:hypothetical protein
MEFVMAQPMVPYSVPHLAALRDSSLEQLKAVQLELHLVLLTADSSAMMWVLK